MRRCCGDRGLYNNYSNPKPQFWEKPLDGEPFLTIMVTVYTEKRAKAEWSLDRVRELAMQQSVIYGSSRVQNTTDNLGYRLADVCECLCRLTPDHFHHSVRYSDSGSWLDVYLIKHRGPTQHEDPLYIKLKLTHDCILLVLCSFHLEGAL